MINDKIEYFKFLEATRAVAKINLLHIDKAYKGYVISVCDDGVFVSTELTLDKAIDNEDVVFVFFAAISSVERGL